MGWVGHISSIMSQFMLQYNCSSHIFIVRFFVLLTASGASLAMRCDIVVLVYPSIGRKFRALLNGQGFMSSPRVNTHRVIVSDAWP